MRVVESAVNSADCPLLDLLAVIRKRNEISRKLEREEDKMRRGEVEKES